MFFLFNCKPYLKWWKFLCNFTSEFVSKRLVPKRPVSKGGVWSPPYGKRRRCFGGVRLLRYPRTISLTASYILAWVINRSQAEPRVKLYLKLFFKDGQRFKTELFFLTFCTNFVQAGYACLVGVNFLPLWETWHFSLRNTNLHAKKIYCVTKSSCSQVFLQQIFSTTAKN